MSRKERPVPELHTLMAGIMFGESPRWHENRLWFSDWGAQELIAVDLSGSSEVILQVPSFPFSIDWLADGRLLIVSASDVRLLRREPDGSLVTHADLAGLSRFPWNEIVVDGRGHIYVNNIGFDFAGGEVAPGSVGLVAPDGSVRQVACWKSVAEQCHVLLRSLFSNSASPCGMFAEAVSCTRELPNGSSPLAEHAKPAMKAAGSHAVGQNRH